MLADWQSAGSVSRVGYQRHHAEMLVRPTLPNSIGRLSLTFSMQVSFGDRIICLQTARCSQVLFAVRLPPWARAGSGSLH